MDLETQQGKSARQGSREGEQTTESPAAPRSQGSGPPAIPGQGARPHAPQLEGPACCNWEPEQPSKSTFLPRTKRAKTA